MRAMIIAGALAAAATSANAAEPAACYDAVVTGWVLDYANKAYVDPSPTVSGRVLARIRADALIQTWSQVAGSPLPKQFWARTVVTQAPDASPMTVIYLKNQPDGVPSVVDFRYAQPIYRPEPLTDYPAC
jgi:hypothetical protein